MASSINDVPGKFRKIPHRLRKSPHFGSTKKYLGARNLLAEFGNDRVIPEPEYTSQTSNSLGLGEHFQGIQRIGQHLIVSGGIKTGKQRSQLIIIRMGSRSKTGPWALPKYGFSYKKPSLQDRIVDMVDVDSGRWHAGGIQACGSVLGIPIYSNDDEDQLPGSDVRFFDFSDPENPTRVDKITIEYRDNTDTERGTKAKAVALAQLPNNHYMTMVWDDKNFDFHYCESEDIKTGFHKPNRVMKDQIEDFAPGADGNTGNGTYQSVNFILDTDGTMYFVATRNSEKGSPTVPGRDYADLYRVDWENDYKKAPKITRVDHRQFFCYNQQCNFGAGTGIYIDDADHMYLYSTPHWLHDGNKRHNFNEYSYA